MISGLVRGFKDVHMLSRAGADHQAAVRTAAPMDRGEASCKGKAVPMDMPKKEKRLKAPMGMCSLCLSRTHVYRAGDYGHKEVNTTSPRHAQGHSRTDSHVGGSTRSQGR